MSDTLLVTGASGHLGQRVLHHLLETLNVPASRVIAASRNPAQLAEWSKRGVTTRASDFDDSASLDAAFKGVQRALLISTNTLDRPGHRLEQHLRAVNAASRAGVQHVVYTSMPKPLGSPVTFAPDHSGTEAGLVASSLPAWTVLRNQWYFENLFMSLPQVFGSGKWFTAAGDGAIAHIARDDLARAAATALAQGGNDKRVLNLTGIKRYTTREIATLAAAAVGKPIDVVSITNEQLVAGLLGAGLPDPIARMLASFDAHTAAGGLAEISGDYKALTGVEPQAFEAWLPANKAALTTAQAEH